MDTFIIGALALLLLAAIYYVSGEETRGATAVTVAADGSTVNLVCGSGTPKVVKAEYRPTADSAPANVKGALQKAIDGLLPGEQLAVTGGILGMPDGGQLDFWYRCASSKSGFRPVPVSTCGGQYDDYYAIDMGNRAGTVAWNPYSTESRISLERYAESPAVAAPINPITGIGKGLTVRILGDRYRRNQAFNELSEYELQPGETGYMEQVGDGAMSLLSAVSRRSPPTVIHDLKHPLVGQEVDSDFLTDGPYGEAVLKESLTSRRHPVWNPYAADRVGLGSVRLDPRFEPGPPERVASGDASPSPGSYAGGITLGALGSQEFRPSAGWDWRYVHGFGDDYGEGYGATEALTTEHSQWGGTSGYV